MRRASTLGIGVALLAALVAAWGVSLAESAAELCDRLAAEPGTVDGVAGVDLTAIDPEPAIAACAAALDEAPGDPRLTHQYARALEGAGRLDDARRLYQWAAADGYAPAAAALERLAAMPDAPVTLPAEAAAKAETLAGLAAVLNRYLASLPPDPADPLTVLAEVGGDPQALLGWVAANTALVAYRGELRGAAGVLIDRSGNSLDRALLLAELLRQSGQEVRLARTALTPKQARLLLPATLRTVAVPALPPLTAEQVAGLFEGEARVDPAMVRQAVEATQQEQERAQTLFRDRMGLVLPALREAVVPFAAEAGRAAEAETLAALADHVWVQLRNGTAWSDLDPDGATLGSLVPSETFEPGKVPAELRQSVTLRVVLELQDSNGRREERLLEWQGFPAELIDRPLQLSHVPRRLSATDLEWLLALPDARERMLAVLDEEQGWMPVLAIGDEVLVDRLFTRDGRVAPANANAFADAGKSIGSLFDEADSLLGGGEGTAPPEPAVPTAEWLEIEVRVPGAAPAVERRTLFDMIGPAAREAGALATFTDERLRERALRLLGETQILLLGAAPSALQVEHIQVRELRALAERLSSLLSSGTIDLDALPAARRPPAPLAMLRFARERMAAPIGLQRAVGSPTVVLQHLRLVSISEQTIEAQVEIDIVRNEVAPAQDFFGTRLAQGVADTVLEALILDGQRNTAVRHAADLAEGRVWTRVDPADLSRLAPAGVPADYRARLQADLAAGYIVIAPAQPEAAAPDELAWWRIDPRNGTALGMLANGGGAAMVEYSFAENALVATFCGAFAALAVSIGGTNQMTVLSSGLGLGMCIAGGFAAPQAMGFAFGAGAGVVGTAVLLLQVF
jgi:hypothetical protein